jgi:hypothetical protein
MQSSAKINDLHISQWFAVCLVLLSGAARPEVYPGYFFFHEKRVLNHEFVKIQKLQGLVMTYCNRTLKFSRIPCGFCSGSVRDLFEVFFCLSSLWVLFGFCSEFSLGSLWVYFGFCSEFFGFSLGSL